MATSCPNCQHGTMEPVGPVCVPGDRRKSWRMCDSCQHMSNVTYHDCRDMTCDVHGR